MLRYCLYTVVALALMANIAKSSAKTFTLQVNDKATAEALPNVDISVRADNSQQKFKTDDQGRVEFTIPDKLQYLNVTAKLDKYVPTQLIWRNDSNSPQNKVPDSYTLNLEPGTTIGGIIQDEQGNPISGATVSILVPGDNASVERPAIWDLLVKTNDKGQWRCDVVPAKLDDVWLKLSHPDFSSDEMYGSTPKPPMEKLRDRTGVMVMKKGTALTGKVTDLDGKPIAGAQVLQGRDRWGSNYPSTKTDKDGNFTFKNAKASDVILTVQAKGYAPDVKEISGAGPVEFKLAPGKTIHVRITDPNGKPVSGASVVADTWRGCRAIQFRTTTDKDGNFYWKDAPEDEVLFDILKRGMGDLRRQKLKAGEETISLTMKPPTKVSGTVVDAATGNPVPDFKVIQGIGWDGQNTTSWQRGRDDVVGKDGKFSYELGYPYPFHAARIEADGYMPAVSRMFKSDEGEVKLEFKLEKGKDVAGILSGPDGKPIAGETVMLILGRSGVQIVNGTLQGHQREGASATTDDAGKFSFPAEPEKFMLVAVNDAGIGRLEVPASSTTRPTSMDLKLEPWATVEGTVKVGPKPAANVAVGSYSTDGNYQPDAPRVQISNETNTDAKGHYVMKRVPPGPTAVSKLIRSDRMTSYTSTKNVDLKPGTTTTVDIGGDGRPVIGKLDLPADVKGESWVAMGFLNTKVDFPKINLPPEFEKKSREEQAKWYQDFQATPEGKAYMDAVRKTQAGTHHYPVDVDKDGKFTAEDVVGGTYTLQIGIQKSSGNNFGYDPRSQLATATKEFEVPEGASAEPLDLGVITTQKPPPPSTMPSRGMRLPAGAKLQIR